MNHYYLRLEPILGPVSMSGEILQYIQALKWPVFAGGVVFALRGSIKKFLDNFRMDEGSAKIPGIGEVTWKKSMQEVSEKVESLPETQELVHAEESEIAEGVGEALERTPSSDDKRETLSEPEPTTEALMQRLVEMRMEQASSWDLIERLVFSDPTGAVLAAWERLGETVYGVAYRHKATVSEREGRNFLLMAQRLGSPNEVVEAVRSLRDLRNQAAHSQIRITPEDAMEYVQAVRKLLVEVERW